VESVVDYSSCFWFNYSIWSQPWWLEVQIKPFHAKGTKLFLKVIKAIIIILLTISVGRFWSVQSVLEFSATNKNLRIISDIERVF